MAPRTLLPPRGPLPTTETDSPGHRRRGRLGSPGTQPCSLPSPQRLLQGWGSSDGVLSRLQKVLLCLHRMTHLGSGGAVGGGSSCRTSPRAEFLKSEASSSGEHFKKPFCAFARLFSCLRNIRFFTKGMRVRKASEKNRCVGQGLGARSSPHFPAAALSARSGPHFPAAALSGVLA